MKTSLVMPVFNASQYIDRALLSVREQNGCVDEVIIVDDGSTDDIEDRVHRWASEIPIKLLKNRKNIGVAKSLRRGVLEASGELIFRLDADDWWENDHVMEIIAAANKNTSAVILASGVKLYDGNSCLVGYSLPPDDSIIRVKAMWDNPLVHSSLAFRKTAYNLVGGYNPNRLFEDYDLILKLLTVGAFAHSNKATVNYSILPKSVSRVSQRVARFERIKIISQNLSLRFIAKLIISASSGVWK
ncbi:glycosyltransferase [Alphaproteobacteria bacterium]|nr:glycosyltransferase [Alphaproteobacteria bacterium]